MCDAFRAVRMAREASGLFSLLAFESHRWCSWPMKNSRPTMAGNEMGKGCAFVYLRSKTQTTRTIKILRKLNDANPFFGGRAVALNDVISWWLVVLLLGLLLSPFLFSAGLDEEMHCRS